MNQLKLSEQSYSRRGFCHAVQSATQWELRLSGPETASDDHCTQLSEMKYFESV